MWGFVYDTRPVIFLLWYSRKQFADEVILVREKLKSRLLHLQLACQSHMHLIGNRILLVLAINSGDISDPSMSRVEILAIVYCNASKYGRDETTQLGYWWVPPSRKRKSEKLFSKNDLMGDHTGPGAERSTVNKTVQLLKSWLTKEGLIPAI